MLTTSLIIASAACTSPGRRSALLKQTAVCAHECVHPNFKLRMVVKLIAAHWAHLPKMMTPYLAVHFTACSSAREPSGT